MPSPQSTRASQGSEDNFQELVLALLCVGSGIELRSSGLAARAFSY